jgi:hypothetical protein
MRVSWGCNKRSEKLADDYHKQFPIGFHSNPTHITMENSRGDPLSPYRARPISPKGDMRVGSTDFHLQPQIPFRGIVGFVAFKATFWPMGIFRPLRVDVPLKTDFWFSEPKLRFPLSHPLWGCGAGPIGAWEISWNIIFLYRNSEISWKFLRNRSFNSVK